MTTLPGFVSFRRRIANSLVARTLFLVGMASALAAAVFIVLSLIITEQRAQEQARQRLSALIEATGSTAGVACFENDKALAQETAQAIVKSRDVLRAVVRCGDAQLAFAERQTEDNSSPPGTAVVRSLFSPFYTYEQIGEISVTPNSRAIDQAVADEVQHVGLMMALFAIGVLVAIGLATNIVILRPVKAISDDLHYKDAAAGNPLAIPEEHAGNELGRLIADINDLLKRVRASLRREHELHLQQVLYEKLRLAASVFEHSQEGIMITDEDGRIIQANRAYTQITGYREDEVFGRIPGVMHLNPEDAAIRADMLAALAETGHWRGEVRDRHKDGSIIPLWLSVNAIYGPSGDIVNYVAIISDLSESKAAEDRIEFLAHYDHLTGLPNRVLVRDRYSRAAISAQREKSGIAFLFVDLDHFKQVNDGLSQSIGDRLLVEIVQRLATCVSDTDTICRHGGDEFIILLTNTRDPSQITGIAQRILDAVANPVDFDGNIISVTASIGIALYPDDGDNFETLLGKADTAMGNVKTAGRNGYRFFSDTMNLYTAEKLHLRALLSDAIRNGEFQLHYQPQIDIATGRVSGVEALIRWPHPSEGNIPPGRFIPIAEESGLILQIGEWVLAEACRQARQWWDAGHQDIVVAVNISALQFNRGNIVELVRKTLTDTGLPPERLELELTESVLLHDIEGTRQTIEALRAIGVTLSIDDFGTGYSSLAYLKQIKVNKLKVDQSFVRDIGHDADDLAIVHAIIQLGRTLQLRVIAEGIETSAQLEILRNHGCNEGQGYHFSRPLPFTDLMTFLGEPRTAQFAAEGLSRQEKSHRKGGLSL